MAVNQSVLEDDEEDTDAAFPCKWTSRTQTALVPLFTSALISFTTCQFTLILDRWTRSSRPR